MSSLPRRRVVALLSGLFFCAATSPLWAQQNRQLERLSKERQRLQREDDPVGRTKTQIRVADILISLISGAVNSSDFDRMQSHLEEYVAAIQDAHDTMMKSGRDAQKRSGGFKDLEIALRRHMRQLEDIGGALTFEQREPVEKARDRAAEIRDVLLRALFGGQNV
jgi:hypothetical protein